MSTRTTYAIACIAVSLLVTPAARAAAEPEAKSPSSHQALFAACAHESKGLRGEEHQSFMSECLHGASGESSETRREAAPARAAAEPATQQSRMKSCNEESGRRSLHGEERRSFMANCLKG